MLLDNPYVADRRVRSEASALASAGHEVTVLAMAEARRPAREFLEGVNVHRDLGPELFDVKKPRYVANLVAAVADRDFDVLHCHDHWTLNVGAGVKKRLPKRPLIYDSHEFFAHWPLNMRPGAGPGLWLKSKIVREYCIWRERKNITRADRVITVNGSIARELQNRFRLPRPPVVVRNIRPYTAIVERDQTVRADLGLPADKRIVVCIGARLHPRTLNLEQVMDELEPRDDVVLVLIAGDHDDLRRHAEGKGYRNVHFYPFVPSEEVVRILSGCDVGLVPTWNRRDLSYWYALDNKLFDYIAAGLPVLATRQPEYVAVVQGHGVGVCVDPDTPGAYSAGLTELLGDYETWRARVRAARQVIDWEHEKAELLRLYDDLGEDQRAG